MIWWWIGNALFLFVIIPTVIVLLNNLLQPTREIGDYIADALEHGVLAIAALDAVDDLDETRELIRDVGAGVKLYGHALDDLL